MRTLECPRVIRLEARNDEELARELLTHARAEHDASDLPRSEPRKWSQATLRAQRTPPSKWTARSQRWLAAGERVWFS